MKIKVSDATIPQLDWLVAKCEGIPEEELYLSGSGKWMHLFRRTRNKDGNLDGRYMTGPDLLFATKWEAGGPLMEREGISILNVCLKIPDNEFSESSWAATYGLNAYPQPTEQKGPTMLIAGMRCYVASELGDEVEVPEELA